MEEYKNLIRQVKKQALDWSVEDSKRCWEKFPGKMKKYDFNKCSKEAVISYHVYCEGKRLLKALKKHKMNACSGIPDPKALYTCRLNTYNQLIPEVNSLKNWIIRERKDFLNQIN